MDERIKQMTFVAAMREFFGVKAGQNLVQFAAELRDIREDRAYFVEGLEKNGYEIRPDT